MGYTILNFSAETYSVQTVIAFSMGISPPTTPINTKEIRGLDKREYLMTIRDNFC